MIGTILNPPMGPWGPLRGIERDALTPRELTRAALVGDGSQAFLSGIDEWGDFVETVRLVLLPIIPPRNERDTQRIIVEVRTSVRGTRWVEFVDE